MEAFVGTWKKVSSSNLDNFLKASGVTESQAQTLSEKMENLCEEISVSGPEVTLVTRSSSGSGKQTKTGRLGHETEFTMPNGQTQKIVFSLEGDTFIEDVVGYSSKRIVRKVEGNTMTETLCNNGVTATVTFVKS